MVHKFKFGMPTEKDALIVEINQLSKDANLVNLSAKDLRKYRDLLKKASDVEHGFIPSGMEELHKESIAKRQQYPFGDD